MKSRQISFLNFLNATSFAVLEDGPSLAKWQESPRISTYGQQAYPANHSATPDTKRGSKTTDICGRYSSSLLNSAVLQSSLESRCFQRLPLNGGIRWQATWKELVTPSGRSLSLLRLSEPIIAETGCTGALWPTPTSLTPPRNGISGAGDSVGLRKIRGLASGIIQLGLDHTRLNPEFVRWLMGFPEVWGDPPNSGDMETP